MPNKAILILENLLLYCVVLPKKMHNQHHHLINKQQAGNIVKSKGDKKYSFPRNRKMKEKYSQSGNGGKYICTAKTLHYSSWGATLHCK